jgi:hypothetical protein
VDKGFLGAGEEECLWGVVVTLWHIPHLTTAENLHFPPDIIRDIAGHL